METIFFFQGAPALGTWWSRSESGGAVIPRPAFRRPRGVGIDGGDGVRDVVPLHVTSADGGPRGVGGVGLGRRRP